MALFLPTPPAVAYRRAAWRSSSAGTPQAALRASGEFSGRETKSRQISVLCGSQRSAT